MSDFLSFCCQGPSAPEKAVIIALCICLHECMNGIFTSAVPSFCFYFMSSIKEMHSTKINGHSNSNCYIIIPNKYVILAISKFET